MMPTPGLPQPGQAVQSLGPSTAVVAGSANVMSTAATPPQQPNVKYTKLWEGILAGQRQQKPVPICKLEGYRQTSSPEKLSADWPSTMQIVRLIDQNYMQSKDYQGKAELLVFRPLSQHGFLVQLAEKKLCAVIQLPSQTLLLASTDKPGRMIGMLFPGDMVVFKPQLSSSGQQAPATGAVTGGASQVLGQAMGQSNFTQGQINNQQPHSQPAYKDQLSMSGPASLQGSGFLP
jgi:mediator of RNA polymerase II transcription subunit 25